MSNCCPPITRTTAPTIIRIKITAAGASVHISRRNGLRSSRGVTHDLPMQFVDLLSEPRKCLGAFWRNSEFSPRLGRFGFRRDSAVSSPPLRLHTRRGGQSDHRWRFAGDADRVLVKARLWSGGTKKEAYCISSPTPRACHWSLVDDVVQHPLVLEIHG